MEESSSDEFVSSAALMGDRMSGFAKDVNKAHRRLTLRDRLRRWLWLPTEAETQEALDQIKVIRREVEASRQALDSSVRLLRRWDEVGIPSVRQDGWKQ